MTEMKDKEQDQYYWMSFSQYTNENSKNNEEG